MPSKDVPVRWGQARRLAFIDARLQFDGRINRKDLIEFFGISVPQASADIGEYLSAAPQNAVYDPSVRSYLATPAFQAVSGRSSALHYLFELYGLARGAIAADECFAGYVPSTGIVSSPSRSIRVEEVARWVRACRDRRIVCCTYQSMEEEGPRNVRLSPHALGFDGLRWHVRAYCHERMIFRDFAIGRLGIQIVEKGESPVDPRHDNGWNTLVEVVLVPHPKLEPLQREAVARDYGMSSDRHVLTCQRAMLFYTLRHLNLESLSVSERPAEQHVIVENVEQVKRWMEEDRSGMQGP